MEHGVSSRPIGAQPTGGATASTGADHVGGPVDLDGGGGFFPDATDSDPLHVGFDG